MELRVYSVELTEHVAELRYRLADAAFRAKWAKTQRDQRALYAEAYAYGQAIQSAYTSWSVPTTGLPWTELRSRGGGRPLGRQEEEAAFDFLKSGAYEQLMGVRP